MPILLEFKIRLKRKKESKLILMLLNNISKDLQVIYCVNIK